MLCVGLTGNIASGKSTALHAFESYGIPIISADKVARDLTSPGQSALQAIIRHFGQDVIDSDGLLNRKQLRQLIFDHPKERIWLENLLHPLIKQAIQASVAQLSSPYCVIEIPLLKSRMDYPYLNRILVITASHQLQIERVMQRDNSTSEQAQAILMTQPDEANRIEIADDILVNNASKTDFLLKIKNLHEKYLQLAAEKSL